MTVRMRRVNPRLSSDRRSTRRQIDKRSDELSHLGPRLSDSSGPLGVVSKQSEVREFEPGRYRATDERIVCERSGCLPLPSVNRMNRRLCATADWGKPMAHEIVTRLAQLAELERSTLVEVPDFVRDHLMPAADRARGQEEVDRRERCAQAASI